MLKNLKFLADVHLRRELYEFNFILKALSFMFIGNVLFNC